MKISIGAGHCKANTTASGAYYGGWHESTIVREVAEELTKQLKAKGHTVTSATVDKAPSQTAYLKEVCQKVNKSGAEMFIQLHCNASASHKGCGVEVWTYRGNKHKQALDICENLSGLGFKNRGVKDGSKFYVIKHTKPKALLVELFFLDNEIDRALYKKHGAKKIAEQIAKAF